MATVPKKVAERIVAGLKRFQPILASAKARDVGESDTVTIIVDMLAEIFGALQKNLWVNFGSGRSPSV